MSLGSMSLWLKKKKTTKNNKQQHTNPFLFLFAFYLTPFSFLLKDCLYQLFWSPGIHFGFLFILVVSYIMILKRAGFCFPLLVSASLPCPLFHPSPLLFISAHFSFFSLFTALGLACQVLMQVLIRMMPSAFILYLDHPIFHLFITPKAILLSLLCQSFMFLFAVGAF